MVTMNTRTRSFCARRRVHLIRTHTHAPLRAVASARFPLIRQSPRARDGGPHARVNGGRDGARHRDERIREVRGGENHPERRVLHAHLDRDGAPVRDGETEEPREAVPERDPAQCRHATARRSVHPAEAIAAADCPMMLLQMSATVNTATNGQNGATAATAAGNSRLSVSPPSMGRSTTCSVLAMSPAASTGTSVPARVLVMNGVMNAAKNVDAVVSTTDKATLALPR